MTDHLKLHSIKTYKSSEATSTGYDIDFYKDFVILTYHTRWQGSEDGAVYRSTYSEQLKAALTRELTGNGQEFERDLATAVADWLETAELTKIKQGYIIR